LADRVCFRPIEVRHGIANHNRARGVAAILRGKRAALEQADAHGAEIAGTDDAKVRVFGSPGVLRGASLDCEIPGGEVRRAVDQSIEVIRRRVDALGATEPNIQRQGNERILVEVPGLQDPQKLKDLLGQYTKSDGRGNVVMVRVNDDALARMDQLVEATIFGSRSECAAFLIGAGIASQKELFDRLGVHTDEIRKLKEQLRQVALDALRPNEPAP